MWAAAFEWFPRSTLTTRAFTRLWNFDRGPNRDPFDAVTKERLAYSRAAIKLRTLSPRRS
jgi:hypothetical protein